MKRPTLFIVAVVLIGVGTMAAWLYIKYFKGEATNTVTFQVARGDLVESVKVRGKIAARNTYELGFIDGGTVAHIYVAKGETVAQGDRLMSVDAAEQQSAVRNAEAALASSESMLAKLRSGDSAEQIAVTVAQVDSAKRALADARQSLIDTIGTSYTVADNAVRNYADSMINNARSASPELAFTIADQQLESAIKTGRVAMETTLKDLEQAANSASSASDLSVVSGSVTSALEDERTFLGLLASAINKAEPSASLPQASIDAWKASVVTARTNVAATISNMTGAQEKWRSADSALALATKELSLQQAGARSEDLTAASAAVDQAANDLAIAKERLARTTLYAPAKSVVKKLYLERGEVSLAGSPAVSLATSNYQVEADVSELDIVKIASGQTVSATLDAFPGETFAGTVLSIDPDEINKDGDTYYRVTFSLDAPPAGMRPGMSSDVTITVVQKTGVLTVPALAVYERDGKHYVHVMRDRTLQEAEISVGISDGESVEVLSGLAEGESVTLVDG